MSSPKPRRSEQIMSVAKALENRKPETSTTSLRTFVEREGRALLTGSQVYGQPTDESDIDLVLYLTKEETHTLLDAFDNQEEHDEIYVHSPDDEGDYAFTSIRVGPLNLLLCHTYEEYQIWKETTQLCKSKGIKLTNEQACEVFDNLRKARSEE